MPSARWTAIALMLASPLLAGERVEFIDGRVLEVAASRIDGEILTLTLEGGGMLALPARLLVGREVVPDPPPKPAAPAGTAGWRARAGEHADLIAASADTHGLDPLLLVAVAEVESNFDPFAVSPKGACGVLQLMPATAERFGVENVFDARENIDAGARYLSWLLERYDGDLELALAAYNSGEGTVDRYGGIPPYPETQHYVTAVIAGTAR